MKIKVLTVDDSTVFRSQIRAALQDHPDIEVVGYASNGKLALEALKCKAVDVMTLDLEMPEMNGLQCLSEMQKLQLKTKVIAFSSHTKSGAESTLLALSLGASDFVTKPTLAPSDTQTPAELIRSLLLPKIMQFQTDAAPSPEVNSTVQRVQTRPPSGLSPVYQKLDTSTFFPKILTIASSTGGPAALEKIFASIRGPVSCPILIAQHMPPLFTATLAERLSKLCGMEVSEAQDGEPVRAGMIRVAPGDFHLQLVIHNGQIVTSLNKNPQRNSVRPCADYLLESAANLYGRNSMGVVLTGMGADGRDGCVAIKKAGGAVLIQSRESCVVFGMPGAIFEANAFDEILDIDRMAEALARFGVCKL